MVNAVLEKFDFSNPQFTDVHAIFVLAIWAVVLACCIWSVLGLQRGLIVKLLLVMLVMVPGIGVVCYGLLLYVPFSPLFLRDKVFPVFGIWRDSS